MTGPSTEPEGLVGRRIGAYRILRLVAQGGMGSVWEAEQDEPRRKVALKTMHHGLASPVARQRFHFESELLARLRHPCIAQVYEAGVLAGPEGTPSMPWFALEFVEGASTITSYADREGLDLEERVQLVLQVCDAVQHAHQRGVLHRDLKPANLLVSEGGFVKVIDFGIARPRRDAAEPVGLTRTGDILGTLEAMSPEQLEGRRDEIDARSDVYALGAVLYELASGCKPFDLGGLTLSEAIRLITESDPAPASRARPRLPREIDWICAKALARDSDQRYAAVGELARDLEAFLAAEPVMAGPPSTVYRLRKLVGRNKVASSATALAVLALVGGLIGTSTAMVRARRAEGRIGHERAIAVAEAKKANAMLDFVLESLSQPDSGQGRELLMVDFLSGLATGIDLHFEEEPLVSGLLHGAVGRAFYRLGVSTDGGAALERAVAALRRAEREGLTELPATLGDLAVVRTRQGRLDEAQALLDEAESLLAGSAERRGSDAGRFTVKRAYLDLARGDFERASARLHEALDGEMLVEEGAEAYELAISLGLVHHRAGRLDEAHAIYAGALARAREQLGAEAPIALSLRLNLAMVDGVRGDLAEATAETEHVVARFRMLLGEHHEDTLLAVNNLAGLYLLAERDADAASLWNETLSAVVGEVPESHSLLQGLRSNLAIWELTNEGDPARARDLLTPVFDWRLEELGITDERTLWTGYQLCRALLGEGRLEEARAILEQAREALMSAHPEQHPLLPLVELALAKAMLAQGDHESSAALVEEMLEAIAAGRRDTSQVTPDDLQAMHEEYLATGHAAQ